MEVDELLRVAEDVAASAPGGLVLYLIYAARQANIESGRNTASPALPKIPSWTVLPAPVQQQVTAISQATHQDVQSVIGTAVQLGKTLNQDVSTAVGSLASLLGL